MMGKENNKFWPYSAIKSVMLSALILFSLPILFLLLHYWKGWPHESSLTVILIGILILGILPVLLALLNIIIERGCSNPIQRFKN
jgi:RsiW-degrading membrane proteinase PrsW (M82 family)